VTHHTSAITFENLDVVARNPIQLDPESLQKKLVGQPRGGYCFEQNGLFLAALLALGFDVHGLIAHVRLGVPAHIEMTRTHMVLRVELPEETYLADVGFGGLTPTAPLMLRTHVEQPTPHETYRLMEAGDEFMLQARLGEDWRDVYCLGLQRQRPVDYELANWFTATNPKAPFLGNVIATRPMPGERRTLFNWRFVRRPLGQPSQPRIIDSTDEYAAILRQEFGLVPNDTVMAAVAETLGRHAPDATPPGPFA
jgi:N-hydroxyarylamine O-acetyltransferase